MLTDIVVFLVFAILATNGYAQGFWRALVGPVCFVVSITAGFLIFIFTKNAAAGFLTSVVGSILLTWALNTVIHLRSDNNPDALQRWSRILGGVVNIVWGGMILLVVLLFLALVPIKNSKLDFVRADMNRSATYQLIAEQVKQHKIMPRKPTPCMNNLCNMSEADQKALLEDKEIQSMMNDPRMKKLLDNPKLTEAIEKQDLAAILSNPDMQALSKDPAFVIKALRVYPKIMKQGR
ncbi:MAG: CvpA family protein [Candidatus Omnitrophica bacterium]|nr:CvpA family protein [Candidatus Omnitrophota bacterium]